MILDEKNYNINKVYASGFSGCGETMSLVIGKRADLIDAYLQISSKWDGSFESTVENEVPVYFFVGKSDEYYGSTPTGGSLVAHDFKIMNWLLTR